MAKDNLQKLKDAYDDELIDLQEIGDRLRWMRDRLREMYLQEHPDHNNYLEEVIAVEEEFEAQRERKNEAKWKLDQAIISDPSYYDNPKKRRNPSTVTPKIKRLLEEYNFEEEEGMENYYAVEYATEYIFLNFEDEDRVSFLISDKDYEEVFEEDSFPYSSLKRKLKEWQDKYGGRYYNPRRLSDLHSAEISPSKRIPIDKIALAALGFMLASKVMKK